MKGPIIRITMGHLVFAFFWNEDVKQVDVYDTHAGGRAGEKFEHIDAISAVTNDPLDLLLKVIKYGESLDLTIDDINYGK
jgi:hypothetical protein